MSILKVAKLGQNVLRQTAEQVSEDVLKSEAAQRLIDNMIETMVDYDGVGLAAPQVHEPLSIITVQVEDNARYPEGSEESVPLTVIVNPEITSMSEEKFTDWEACLSLPGLGGLVERSLNVTVKGYDRHYKPLEFEAKGFFARVLQHEIDHLHGKVFIDRMKDMRSLAFTD